MATVRDMIRKKGGEVFHDSPDATVYDALVVMAKHNTGALMVVSGSKVEGILSERDCVRRVDLEGRVAKDTKVSEIMTTKVIYVEAAQQLEECMAVMIDKNIRHLPVYDDKELLGLISVRDVLKEVVDVQKFMISQLEHYITGVGVDMHEHSIAELQQKMTAGELSSRQLAELYLERIDSLDRNGPRLNSVIETNPDALSSAASLDEERRSGRLRGPLHGIPILLKDNIDTHDAMQTTAGSLAMQGNIASSDAFIVKQLRKAGALILGKTNLSEWANFRGKHSISGWSSRGGLTRNPYVLDRSACGSSSGSGAAVAANLCAAAIGTETDGSIICPAQTNGIVGIKPTLGLLSRSGIIPIAHSQDTAGPMARTVADAAALLGAMAGLDPRDPSTKAAAKHGLSDYTRFLDVNGLKGARIGVARNMAGSDVRIAKIFEASIEVMKQLGAVMVDPANVPNFNKFGKTETDVLHFEFKAGLNKYLASANAPVKSMADVIKFNEENKARVLQYFGQEHLLTAQETGDLRDKKYRQALARNLLLTRKNGIDAALKKYRLDAIIVPSGGPAWMMDLVNGDAVNWDMESTSPAAVAGYPHITVPAGYVAGLPVGISFFAKAWQEPTLIKFAYAFEQATKTRKPPQFLPGLEK